MCNLMYVTLDLLQTIILLLVVVYAPFSRTWRGAIGVVFFVSAIWGILRIVVILAFGEGSPPLIAFLAMPFFTAVYAAIARSVKMLLFRIPFLERIEHRYLTRRAELRTQSMRRSPGGAG